MFTNDPQSVMNQNKRNRKKEIRKERIIDSAEEVIRRDGFEQATMDEIARQAELAKGTLYLYFKSKTEIYLAIHIRGSFILNERLRVKFLENKSGLEILDGLGNTYLQFIKEFPIYFMAATHYENLLSKSDLGSNSLVAECESLAKEAMTYIVRALQIGIQDGTIRGTFDPYQLGLIIWSASRGLIHTARHMEILEDNPGERSIELTSLLGIFISILRTGIINDQKSEILKPRDQINVSHENKN